MAVGAPFPDSDREGWLLVEARRRPEAFTDLYRMTERRLVGYFFRRTACAATAAELTSETFAAALAGFRRFDPEKGTGIGWLFGIASHLLSQWQRHERVEEAARRRMGMRIGPLEAPDLERIEALVDFGPLACQLPGALGELSPAVRDAVVLRFVEQLPYEEISSRLGCTAAAARVRVSRGLDRLEQLLGVTWATP